MYNKALFEFIILVYTQIALMINIWNIAFWDRIQKEEYRKYSFNSTRNLPFYVDSTYKQIILSVIKSIKIGGKVLFPESELNDLIKKLKEGSWVS